jgi:HTH-type transcriptional regulator / antitoxin HipB
MDLFRVGPRHHHRAGHGHVFCDRQCADRRPGAWAFGHGWRHAGRGVSHGVCLGLRWRVDDIADIRVHGDLAGGGRLHGVDRLDVGAQLDHGCEPWHGRCGVDANGVWPGLHHLCAEPQGLHVHARRLSAIHAAALRAGVGAGGSHGADHHCGAGFGLWRARPGGGEIAGLSDGVSGGDNLDWESCGRAVLAGGGGDCSAGGDGLNAKSKLLLTFLNVCYNMHFGMNAIIYIMSIAIRTPNEVGALIRDRRRALKMNQAELAQRIGVSRLWVNQVERGKPGASLGLVLRALNAVGGNLSTTIENTAAGETQPNPVFAYDINAIVEAARKRRSVKVADGDRTTGFVTLNELDLKNGK